MTDKTILESFHKIQAAFHELKSNANALEMYANAAIIERQKNEEADATNPTATEIDLDFDLDEFTRMTEEEVEAAGGVEALMAKFMPVRPQRDILDTLKSIAQGLNYHASEALTTVQLIEREFVNGLEAKPGTQDADIKIGRV